MAALWAGNGSCSSRGCDGSSEIQIETGSAEAVERCQPLFHTLGQGTFVVGSDAWLANVVKLGGNFLIASMLEALGEAFVLMRKCGVDPRQFLEVVNGALFKSPLYENYGRIVAEERLDPPGFQLRLGLKDARLVLSSADQVNVPMPLAGLIHDHLLAALARGMGEKDWSAFTRIVVENSGLKGLSSEERHSQEVGDRFPL
jgi:3-hydroxyisobutyrate dehydrogenase-like beta-hydroxyacid dehydrogenase